MAAYKVCLMLNYDTKWSLKTIVKCLTSNYKYFARWVRIPVAHFPLFSIISAFLLHFFFSTTIIRASSVVNVLKQYYPPLSRPIWHALTIKKIIYFYFFQKKCLIDNDVLNHVISMVSFAYPRRQPVGAAQWFSKKFWGDWDNYLFD